jgi:hypothetical protein
MNDRGLQNILKYRHSAAAKTSDGRIKL